jgi:hypothetical protein
VAAFLLSVAIVIVPCCAVVVAAHRFARRREREGLWNANGPIHPSEPPAGWLSIPGYQGHRPEIVEETGDRDHDEGIHQHE